MTCEAWHKQPRLQQRLDLYLGRAEAAADFARTAATLLTKTQQHGQTPAAHNQLQQQPQQLGDHLAFIEEQVGDLQLIRLQNAPPLYNQMQFAPHRSSAVSHQARQVGLKAFGKASQLLPDEWEFQLNLAKLFRKDGASDARAMWHLAKACCLARLHAGGQIEPVYQLHALRLKLLQQPNPDLTLLSRYSFNPQQQTEPMHHGAASPALQGNPSVPQQDQFVDTSAADIQHRLADPQPAIHASSTAEGAVFEDATAAMTWCLDQSKCFSKSGKEETFHKARYRQAQALSIRGRHAEALQTLQPLFQGRRSSHSFSISVHMIDVEKSSQVPLCCTVVSVCLADQQSS